MTTYIALFNLTDAGIKAAKDSPRRLDAAKKLLADMGGETMTTARIVDKWRAALGRRGAGDASGISARASPGRLVCCRRAGGNEVALRAGDFSCEPKALRNE
jgi:hypothetical protein